MRLGAKIGIGVLGVVVVGTVGLVTTAQLRWNRTFDAPKTGIVASNDPEVVERGRYLVHGPAHCAGCHGDIAQLEHYEKTGEEIPLSGGFEMRFPPGVLRPPNITPCEKTGIGGLSDEQLARSLRYGIHHEGRMLFPIMPFANLSDEDLTAVVSYLRSLEPVTVEREPTEFSLLGKAVLTFVLAPLGPRETPHKSIEPAPTAEYGEYLVKNVSNCDGCHTNRDLVTGEPFGEELGGGLSFEHRGTAYVVPNITLGGEGSRARGWDEAGFIARMRTGQPSAEGSPMPWVAYAKMTDEDLQAIYAYMQTVDPVDFDAGPAVFED